MTYKNQIEKLKNNLDKVRTNKDYDKITNNILKLAKKYNSLDYRDEYIIIDKSVYGTRMKR